MATLLGQQLNTFDLETIPGIGSGGSPSTNDFRLTLESGVPVSTSDQTAKATLYLTPFKGNKIGLYSGSAWSLLSSAEVSVSLAAIAANKVYDVFALQTAGVLSPELLVWLGSVGNTTATNNPAAGASVAINVPDTTGLAIGQNVVVSDATYQETCVVESFVANTSITVVTLVNNYTAPSVAFRPVPATAVVRQDGVLVKSGDATRRWIGTIAASGAGTCEDSLANRLVYNADNQVERRLQKTNTTSHTYSTGVQRPWNNDQPNSSSNFVIGRVGVTGYAHHAGHALSAGTPVLVFFGLGLNGVQGGANILYNNGLLINTNSVNFMAEFGQEFTPAQGFNYLCALESGGGASTQTWPQVRIGGTIPC